MTDSAGTVIVAGSLDEVANWFDRRDAASNPIVPGAFSELAANYTVRCESTTQSGRQCSRLAGSRLDAPGRTEAMCGMHRNAWVRDPERAARKSPPPERKAMTPTIPGAYYGTGVSHLDEHCRWMMRAGRAPRTVKVRRMYMQYLAEYLGRDPVDVTQFELEDWQDGLPVERLRFATAMVRPYYGYLHKRGIRADNPAALLVTPKQKRGLPRPIEFYALERAIRNAPSPRLQAWLILAAYAGLRAKEIAHLEMDCFEEMPDGGVFIRLTRTKGEYERISALPAWAWLLIRPALAPSGACFRRERGVGPVTPQQVSQLANVWLHKSGTRSTLHTLRHWAGSSGIEVEDLRVVQEFLGHADPSTTAIYTAVQQRRIADMVNRFPRPDV
ncbi:tyrosine-type recombinase/integrase [Mycobacterium sp. CVI_P3]|uniref:Tyrosine-type recombinase/integrase n=1 Tax=Mycobacterium pinniadriaticum TaxID=2994102 RepID=A0ABT3SLP2_9MYCO|nr:tyrosine-type recombinase/integrase [Mycobacterium pinniadriaticum]MCX2934057.1 tyrosine-type recombinase/integrase [Mycobacterium pinniadriaticum]MCX2940446.1 tyrosine-type recombinase/integrase [Mycobacterium pinniadriaticum]